MLILLTQRCSAECSHCMENATATGRHMEAATFEAVKGFVRQIHSRLLLLSGGELTEHPNFYQMVSEIAQENLATPVIMLSNGLFYRDRERYQQVEDLLRKYPTVHMQIRTHPLYYKFHEEIMANAALKKLSKTVVYDDCIQILPVGRASGWETKKQYPSCINTFLVAHQKRSNDIATIVHTLESAGKHCIPMVDWEGNLHAGESIECVSLGNVNRTGNVLAAEPCGKCGLQSKALLLIKQFLSLVY